MRLCAPVLVGLAALAPPAAAQTIYRCGDTYSQSPCAPDARVVVAPPAAPVTPAKRERIPDTATPEQAEAGAEICRESLRATLRDPESARFKPVSRAVFKGGLVQYVGRYNAKNGYGGYVGEQVFICHLDPTETRVTMMLP